MEYGLLKITEKSQGMLDELLEGTNVMISKLRVKDIEPHLDELKAAYNLKNGFTIYYFTEDLYIKHFNVPERVVQKMKSANHQNVEYIVLANVEREVLNPSDITFVEMVSHDIGLEADLNYHLINVNHNNQDEIFRELYKSSAIVIPWVNMLEDINMYVNVLKNKCGLHNNCTIYYFVGYNYNTYYNITNPSNNDSTGFIAIKSDNLDDPDNIWGEIKSFDEMVDEDLDTEEKWG